MKDDKDDDEAVDMWKSNSNYILKVHSTKYGGRLDMEGEGKVIIKVDLSV